MNVQGEEQKKLDVISNDVLKNALRSSGESCMHQRTSLRQDRSMSTPPPEMFWALFLLYVVYFSLFSACHH